MSDTQLLFTPNTPPKAPDITTVINFVRVEIVMAPFTTIKLPTNMRKNKPIPDAAPTKSPFFPANFPDTNPAERALKAV